MVRLLRNQIETVQDALGSLAAFVSNLHGLTPSSVSSSSGTSLTSYRLFLELLGADLWTYDAGSSPLQIDNQSGAFTAAEVAAIQNYLRDMYADPVLGPVLNSYLNAGEVEIRHISDAQGTVRGNSPLAGRPPDWRNEQEPVSLFQDFA